MADQAITGDRFGGVSAESHALVLPGEPVTVRLMNTIWADIAGVHDDLASPADLDVWLIAVGAVRDRAGATQTDHEEARSLRDALRRLASFRTDDRRPTAQSPTTEIAGAIAVVNAMAAALPPARLARHGELLVRAESTGVSTAKRALAAIAVAAVALFAGPSADQLRACRAPGCVLYFVKAHPRREWCSVACGNRARVARHYRRVRAQTT
jgi:predicted RNA-binding Zn ribbon-like protein